MVLCNPKIKIFDLQKITVGLIQEPHTDVLRCNVCWGREGQFSQETVNSVFLVTLPPLSCWLPLPSNT